MFPSIQRWLRPYKPLTIWQYTGTMLYFLDTVGPDIGVKDPDSFLAWAKSTDGMVVQDILEKFAETKTPHQRLQAVSELRSFLGRNGKVDLPRPGMTRQAPEHWHRAYKKEEVHALLSYLDQKIQKLYVYFAKDSGLRPVHILQVLYRHLQEDLDAGKEYVYINFDPPAYQGRKVAGRTFIGPETVRLLKECISEQLIGDFEEQESQDPRTGKETVSKKFIALRPNSPIFPFSYSAITTNLKLARRKAKLDPLLQLSGGLRKYFENALDRVGMDHHKKLQLEGHSAGTRDHYTSRDVDELRTNYQLAYRFLDLSGNVERDLTVEQLQRKLEDQNQVIESLRKDAGSWESMAREQKLRLENFELRFKRLEDITDRGSRITNDDRLAKTKRPIITPAGKTSKRIVRQLKKSRIG